MALDQQGQPIPGVDIVGRPINDAEIGVRISILEASPTGNVLYQEEHVVLTDQYGMFNLTIGQGLQVSADAFNSINWQGDKFLQVELSIENDGEFTLSAVQQLMSVPYAFLADRALNVDDADADPTNELQALSISNDTLYLSSGGYVVLPPDQVNDADADPTNELQAISMSNDTLYLSSGGFVVLPPDQINDADADPTNEFQTITRNGSTINLSGNGGSVTVFDGDYTNLTNTPTIPSKTSDLVNDSGFLTSEVDGSTTNEIQTLSKSGSTISLSDNGGSVTVFDGDYNNLSNTPSIPTSTSDLTNDSGFLTSEVDGSTTNEIQTLSKSGSTISLSDNGGSVTVFDGDYNNLSNSPSIPTNTSDLTNDSGFITSEVDGSTTNEIQILSISNDTIFLSGGGFVKLPASQGFDGDYNSLTNTPSIPTLTSDLTNDSGFLTSEVDGSTSNELQALSISNDTIYLSSGGFVKLPAGFDGAYSSLTGTPSIPTLTSDLTNDSGFLTTEVDGSTTNELQVLSLSNDTLYLTDGGFVVLPSGFDGNYNNLTNTPAIPTKTSDLTNDSGFISIEQDSSVTNELQTLSISNDTLFLSNGGFVKLPTSSQASSSSTTPIGYLTETGTVAGTMNPTTITSGANMTKITVPADKVYNIRHVKLVGDGAGHRHGLKVNGIVIWENESNNGDCDIWLGPGDELEHYYGQWAGANGSFSDSWLISIHVYDSSQVASTSTYTGTVAGTMNPTTITSGANMTKITVPADKVYNIRHVKLVGDGAGHRHGLKVNGIVIWENESNNGDCDIWLGPGDELEHYYGQWAGANGSFSDSWLISIREYDK